MNILVLVLHLFITILQSVRLSFTLLLLIIFILHSLLVEAKLLYESPCLSVRQLDRNIININLSAAIQDSNKHPACILLCQLVAFMIQNINKY